MHRSPKRLPHTFTLWKKSLWNDGYFSLTARNDFTIIIRSVPSNNISIKFKRAARLNDFVLIHIKGRLKQRLAGFIWVIQLQSEVGSYITGATFKGRNRATLSTIKCSVVFNDCGARCTNLSVHWDLSCRRTLIWLRSSLVENTAGSDPLRPLLQLLWIVTWGSYSDWRPTC